jgi:hypothetical protein
MKLLSFSIALLIMMGACKSVDDSALTNQNSAKISSNQLVGKWSPAYIQKGKGVGEQWTSIQTLVALPSIEFTAQGDFLMGDKPGADCCGFIGNKYVLNDNKVTFSDFKPCPNVSCIAMVCEGWVIEKIGSDTIVVDDCFKYSKYIRTK